MNFFQKIKILIKRSHKIDYIQKCILNAGDYSFRELVLGLHRDPFLVEYESLGNLNPDKTLYIFRIATETDGFFAVYKNLLESLYFADRLHFIPVVDFTEKYLYRQNDGFENISNPYEYYFEQPSGITVEEANSSFLVVRHRYKDQTLISPLRKNIWYNVTEDYITSLANMAKKYIRLNSTTGAFIEEQKAFLLQNKRTLGVHVRGTDFQIAFNGAPVPISTEEYIKAVRKAMQENNFDQLFLATDDESVLARFQTEFCKELVYYKDVMRAKEQISVAFLDAERENHQYLLGLEVLRDMHTLAACDGLVAGLSSVSTVARITKISKGEKYEYINILDHGLNSNTREFYPVGIKLIKKRG